MYTITPVGGHIGGECSLLTSPKSAVLLDAGFNFSAGKTVDNLQTVLAGRPLDYILASHTHYDHMSGIPTIKARFPELRVVASPHAKKVISGDRAKALMRSLNASCAADSGIYIEKDTIDDLSVDIALEDGETLELADMTIKAVATPGHTRCAMSYYFPDERLLVSSETLGIAPQFPEVTPCFIVSYLSTLESIERSRALRPTRVLIPHSCIVSGEQCDRFFDNARSSAEKAANLLVAMHDRGCRDDEIVDAFIMEFYGPSAALQPERAFILNTREMIPRVLSELGRTRQKTA